MTGAMRLTATRPKAELGWHPTVAFEEGLAATITWYQTHTEWVDRVRSGAYRTAERTEDSMSKPREKDIRLCVRL